ncbi:MAG: S8 family serine peptidase [Syntrophobacteraceae bacterium]
MVLSLRKLKVFFAVLFAWIVIAGITGVEAAAPAQRPEKVDSWVLENLPGGKTEFLVFLSEQADLSGAKKLASKAEKAVYVYETLKATAARTQKPVLDTLKSLGAEYKPFWVANMVWVRGDAAAVNAMSLRPDVKRVHANPVVRLQNPQPPETDALPNAIAGIEWNISHVNAPDLWSAGFTGQNVVVAGQDTGYQWDHPALKNKYRGWNGAAASHDYSWHDAIHSPSSSSCDHDSPVPCDDHSHGTHTMGTIVGDDGGANQVGMAPGARWIGCRNMAQGYGTPATYAECYQWFIAPTKIDGTDPAPAMAPDVINNSWSCPPSEGCNDPQVLLSVVENVRAAGILTVHSAGNSGPGCSSVSQPAGIYSGSFTVGATDSSDSIASFSSRGPVTVDGSQRRKPDISAPGVNIRSSVTGSGYSTMSGTSMAGPHVAGLSALLLSANPRIAGQVDFLESIIEQSAVALFTSQGCGGDASDEVPNNVYGWGRIDAQGALGKATATGSLTVTLAPVEAAEGEGRWRVDAGPWKVSGESLPGLIVGSHTVDFKSVSGWKQPESQQVLITETNTHLDATYTRPALPWLFLLLDSGS